MILKQTPEKPEQVHIGQASSPNSETITTTNTINESVKAVSTTAHGWQLFQLPICEKIVDLVTWICCYFWMITILESWWKKLVLTKGEVEKSISLNNFVISLVADYNKA